jgi:hypothetical protein
MQEGDMTLFAAGRYLHQAMREAGAWKFARKTVVLDSRQITLLAIPLWIEGRNTPTQYRAFTSAAPSLIRNSAVAGGLSAT